MLQLFFVFEHDNNNFVSYNMLSLRCSDAAWLGDRKDIRPVKTCATITKGSSTTNAVTESWAIS